MKNFQCSLRLPADSFLIPSLNFRVQENSFHANLRMSMLRRWRWIFGVIPVAYPPPGIWQGRNGKWLGQKYAAAKHLFQRFNLLDLCVCFRVCAGISCLGRIFMPHIWYITKPDVPWPVQGENRSRWEGGNFATKAPGVSHRSATWVWKGFSTWSFERLRSPRSKTMFLRFSFSLHLKSYFL